MQRRVRVDYHMTSCTWKNFFFLIVSFVTPDFPASPPTSPYPISLLHSCWSLQYCMLSKTHRPSRSYIPWWACPTRELPQLLGMCFPHLHIYSMVQCLKHFCTCRSRSHLLIHVICRPRSGLSGWGKLKELWRSNIHERIQLLLSAYYIVFMHAGWFVMQY